jgi:nicotinamide-nucleotide amidase
MSDQIYAEIVTTGSEMMLGRLVDSNSAWLSEYLAGQGVAVARHTAVGDDQPRLVEAYRRAWAEHRVVIATGGLGPTEDDLARPAAAEAFGLELEFHEKLAAELRDLFRRRGYILTENNLRQAWLPRSTLVVPNPLGTAPGFARAEAGRLMVFLPGVPREMKAMAHQWVTPRLKEQFPGAGGRIKTLILKTVGLGESMVDSRISDLMAGPDQNPAVGLLAAPDMVRVVVTAAGDSDEAVAETLAPLLAELEKRLAGHIFSRGEETLPQVVAALLKEAGLRLSLVDSVSRGRLSGFLGPALDSAAWAGSLEPPEPAGDGDSEPGRAFTPPPLTAGEIRLGLTARPDPEAPPPRPGEIALVFESTVSRPGWSETRRFALGGLGRRALARAAALAAFHLWQILTRPQPLDNLSPVKIAG